MIYLQRTLGAKLEALAKKFVVLGLFGPRQSGKTTLLKEQFPDHAYVNLELPSKLAFAKEDPQGFMRQHMKQGRIFIDEVQRVPELFSVIQVLADEDPQSGRFILSGSHNFLLMEGISQSLAGRIALTTLLPLSYSELKTAYTPSLETVLFNGLYPGVWARDIHPTDWYPSYISTYVERDVRDVLKIGDVHTFSKFLRLCAARIGNNLNLTELGRDCGISHNTASQWLSVLEASYLIFLLQPYHDNYSKRQIKTPKLYFYDTGLVCSLLNIREQDQLIEHTIRGHLFENFIVADLRKRAYNQGRNPSLYFFKDSHHFEVDVVVDTPKGPIPIEIKSVETPSADLFSGIVKFQSFASNSIKPAVIYGGEESQVRKQGLLQRWRDMDELDID